MKKMIMFVLAGLIPMVGMAGPVRFRMELAPGGVVANNNAKLDMSKTGTYGTQEYITDGTASYMGSLQLGIDIDTKVGYLDLLVGGGLLASGIASENLLPVSGTFMADIGYRFKLNQSGTVCLGPFLGFIIPSDTSLDLANPDDPSWYYDESSTDEESAKLSGYGGVQGGLKFTAGGEHVSFLLKAGYVSYGYDIKEVDPGWSFSTESGDGSIDMSGPFVQIGLSLQF